MTVGELEDLLRQYPIDYDVIVTPGYRIADVVPGDPGEIFIELGIDGT